MNLEIGKIYKVINNIVFYTPEDFIPQLIREGSIITILDKHHEHDSYKIMTSIVFIDQDQTTYNIPKEGTYCNWLHSTVLAKGRLKCISQ